MVVCVNSTGENEHYGYNAFRPHLMRFMHNLLLIVTSPILLCILIDLLVFAISLCASMYVYI